MFWASNFLLLALFAAVPVSLAAALYRTRSLPAALAGLWAEEAPLFFPGGEALRQKLGGIAFVAAAAVYEANVAICNSNLRLRWPILEQSVSDWLDTLVLICLLGKILLGTRYSWRQLAGAGAALFIVRWVFFNCHDQWLMASFLFVFAAKDAPIFRALRAYFAAGLLTVGLVVLCAIFGVVENVVGERGEAVRYAFGYGHPNTLGGLLLGLGLAWALLNAARPRLTDCAVLLGLAAFAWFGPASRSAAVVLVLCAVALPLCRLLPRLMRSPAIPILGILLVVVLIAAFLYGPSSLNGAYADPNKGMHPAWVYYLDKATTGRMYMIWNAYQFLHFTIAGQNLALNEQTSWITVDTCYVNSLYAYGVVLAVLIWTAALATVWKLFRRGAPAQGCLFFLMLLYAFMEWQYFHFTTNPCLLLMAGVLFGYPARAYPLVAKEVSPKPKKEKPKGEQDSISKDAPEAVGDTSKAPPKDAPKDTPKDAAEAVEDIPKDTPGAAQE